MTEETKLDDASDKKADGGEWSSFARNLALSITPLFFGSLLFSGVIEGYKDDLSSKRAIVIDQFRPMRETALSCHNLHNRLALEHNNLAGSYTLLSKELKRIVNETESLGPDYANVATALLTTRSETEKKVDALKSETDACYNKLWRQYEELAIVSGSYDDFIKISSSHAAKMNAIYRKREDDVRRMSGGTDLEKLWDSYVGLLNDRERNKGRVKSFAEGNPDLFLVPINFSIYMSKSEMELLGERDAVMDEAGALFARKINGLFSEGFFHRLFRVI